MGGRLGPVHGFFTLGDVPGPRLLIKLSLAVGALDVVQVLLRLGGLYFPDIQAPLLVLLHLPVIFNHLLKLLVLLLPLLRLLGPLLVLLDGLVEVLHLPWLLILYANPLMLFYPVPCKISSTFIALLKVLRLSQFLKGLLILGR